jgi:NADH-quinone oxidoreductase subunit H
MTILGASASGNPHAAVGASREMKLLLSYELPLILVMLVAVARTGWTFQLGAIITEQQAPHGPVLFSISGVLAMIIAIVCVQAKLGMVPFDMAEAECEIMSGVYVEYSGPSLGMFVMARAMMLALLPLLLIVLFWGGLGTGVWWGYLSFLGKYVLLVALATLIRNTNPRLRIDQTMKFFWFGLTPLAILAVGLALAGM